MSRKKLCAPHWTLPIVLACLMPATAAASPAQFGGFGKIIKKAQDMGNSKQGQEVKKGIQALSPLTLDQEKDIGREVAAKLIGYYHLFNDPELTRYVNLVGATVAAQSLRQDIQYHFAILDSNDINAFSAPGGYIFVTRGALALCDDESELAGVLAHEVAHVADKHVVHVIENDKKTRTGKEVASDYAQGSPLLDKLANTGIKALTQGLAPKDEYEADHDGVEFAHAAGYPADGLERFLTKLNQATNQGANSFWTRTHPPVPDRNARIQQLIASNKWPDSEGYKLTDRFVQETAVLRSKPQT
jgi:predicted Zn-dependent protease